MSEPTTKGGRKRPQKETAARGVGAPNSGHGKVLVKQGRSYIKPARGCNWIRLTAPLAAVLGVSLRGGAA